MLLPWSVTGRMCDKSAFWSPALRKLAPRQPETWGGIPDALSAGWRCPAVKRANRDWFALERLQRILKSLSRVRISRANAEKDAARTKRGSGELRPTTGRA